MTGGRTLLRSRYGSHLFGTSTPHSDLDYRSVVVPPAADILLGRAKGSVSTKRPRAVGEKSHAGEVEEESYTLQRYLGLLAEGQTVAIDLLFTPASERIVCDALWLEIVGQRHRLLTRKSAAFVGYCKAQANKYGLKGSRVAAARTVLRVLDEAVERWGTVAKLGILDAQLRDGVALLDFVSIVPVTQVSGQATHHLEVCGRKLPYTASIKTARDVVRRLVDEYGHRALQAESQRGVDWKALSHAVRIARQAVELLETGFVTFPRPEAEHLLAIKTGRLAYRHVAEEVERLLADVEAASARSVLPAVPDHAWIDAVVMRAYGQEVVGASQREPPIPDAGDRG